MTNSRRPLILATVVAVGMFALLVSGCGSSASTPAGASTAASQVNQARTPPQGAVQFSHCMRSHGVPGFPDPTSGSFKYALAPSTPKSPAFSPAFAACRHLMPNFGVPGQAERHSPAQIAAFVAFARCIRSHGFPEFPDPSGTGQLNHQMLAAAGINLQQPGVVPAADACVGVTHGLITKAAVARFASGQ